VIFSRTQPGYREGGPKVKQFTKPGGVDQANKDFDALQPTDVKDLGNGLRTGTLPGGGTVSVRPQSSQGSPTIQVNRPGGKPVKIRYD